MREPCSDRRHKAVIDLQAALFPARPRRIARQPQRVRVLLLQFRRKFFRRHFMAIPFDVQVGSPVDFLVGKNNVNERQIAQARILQRIAGANLQFGRRPGFESYLARFFQNFVTGSQRHGAAGGAKQEDHSGEQSTKRTRRDANQDARILAVRAENRKEKMEKRPGFCACDENSSAVGSNPRTPQSAAKSQHPWNHGGASR